MEEDHHFTARINHGSQVLHNSGHIINNYIPDQFLRVLESLQGSIARTEHLDGSSGPQIDKSSNVPQDSSAPSPSVEKYLSHFQYERTLIPEDCNQIMNQKLHRFSLDHNRLQALVSAPKLTSWLMEDCSSTLLINGSSDSSPMSETSLFAARIVQMRQGCAGQTTLAFFCGQHRDSQDVYSNPSEIAMSLLMQLIDACRELSERALRDAVEGLVPTDVGSICRVFQRLVASLKAPSSLYILVDGVQFFEEPADRGQQTFAIVESLMGICRGPQRTNIKLLFTNPGRAAFIEGLFKEEQILVLPRYCLPASAFAKMEPAM